MANKVTQRIYHPEQSIVFQKNNEPNGDLSNMASAYPLRIYEVQVRTNEALYQACKFSTHPDIQREILEQKSPMAVKFKSREHQDKVRSDWDEIKTDVMRWCLRVKLVQNFEKFSTVLLRTGDMPIVERSKIDGFWGARPQKNGTLQGCNVLGRLLMEMRKELKQNPESFHSVQPLQIPAFMFLGEVIGVIQPENKSFQDINELSEENSTQMELPF